MNETKILKPSKHVLQAFKKLAGIIKINTPISDKELKIQIETSKFKSFSKISL